MSDPSKKIEGDIDRFDDVFHGHGDDIDEAEDVNIDYDQFFSSFYTNDDTNMENIDYEEFFNDFYKKDDVNVENIDYDQFFTEFYSHDDKNKQNIQVEQQTDPVKVNENVTIDLINEEQYLSEKLSQISATENQQQIDEQNKPTKPTATTEKKRPSLTPTTPVAATTRKKLRTDIVELSSSAGASAGSGTGSGSNDNDMLNYLSNSSQIFEDMINPILQKSANTITTEDLRQIALLEHKIKIIDINASLWTIYLRSGTGKLKEDEHPRLQIAAAGITTTSVRQNLSIWPKELKSIMLADRSAKFKPNEINPDTCLDYVYKMLRTFREQNTHYQTQLKQMKQRLNNCFTLEMQEIIKSFVEEYGISSHRLKTEGKIAVIQYDYNDQLFKSDFDHQTPYQDQLTIFKNLSQLKLDKEVSKIEVALLKQRIAHNHLSSVLNSIQIPLPTTLDTIEDKRIRQSLIYRYEQITQRTKSEMTTIHVRAAEAKMEEYAKKIAIDFKQYNETQRLGPIDKKLTKTMDYIMQQRFKNIEERVTTLYKLKVRFFAKAPTVVSNN